MIIKEKWNSQDYIVMILKKFKLCMMLTEQIQNNFHSKVCPWYFKSCSSSLQWCNLVLESHSKMELLISFIIKIYIKYNNYYFPSNYLIHPRNSHQRQTKMMWFGYRSEAIKEQTWNILESKQEFDDLKKINFLLILLIIVVIMMLI